MDWYLTDSKSRITREIHAVEKTREFHDNESETISGESGRTPFSFIVFFLVIRNSSNKRRLGGAAFIRGRRLF